MAHVRCLLQILLEFSRNCVDSSNSDLDNICASAGVRSHVTLKGPRGSGRGLLWCQRWQIIRCKETDHITCHTMPQPISGPIQIK